MDQNTFDASEPVHHFQYEDESLKIECTAYACSDYLRQKDQHVHNKGSPLFDESNKVTPNDRMALVDWIYSIVDKCKLERESVAVAMNIADRFMSTQQGSTKILYNRGQYQLLLVAAIYIAIKINERVIVSSKDLSIASWGMYSSEQIENMEMKILSGLKWRLHCPTALKIGCHILRLLWTQAYETNSKMKSDVWYFLHQELAYQAENAVRGYQFTTERPSTIATVAIMNAIEQVNDDADYKLLMDTLVSVLKRFKFDSPFKLLNTKNELRNFINENEECESVVSESTEICHGSTMVKEALQGGLPAVVSSIGVDDM